jgi:hypothetical protein
MAAIRPSFSEVGMYGGGRISEAAGSPISTKLCSMPAGVVSCSNRAGVSPLDPKGVRHILGQVGRGYSSLANDTTVWEHKLKGQAPAQVDIPANVNGH